MREASGSKVLYAAHAVEGRRVGGGGIFMYHAGGQRARAHGGGGGLVAFGELVGLQFYL